jgi:hypothetical protein
MGNGLFVETFNQSVMDGRGGFPRRLGPAEILSYCSRVGFAPFTVLSSFYGEHGVRCTAGLVLACFIAWVAE